MNQDRERLEGIKLHRRKHGYLAHNDEDWLVIELDVAWREIERLRNFEATAKWISDRWNEFEEPLSAETRIQEPLENICTWAADWYARAEKAESDLADWKHHTKEATKEAGVLKTELTQARERIAELEEHLHMMLGVIEHETNLPGEAANGVVAPDGSDEGIAITGRVIREAQKAVGYGIWAKASSFYLAEQEEKGWPC